MKTIISDLPYQTIKSSKTQRVFDSGSQLKSCIGCFACWIKTPTTCIIKDEYSDIVHSFLHCDEIIIITQCLYGGYSPVVKNVMDRSISFLLPFFTIRNNEMHHIKRSNKNVKLSVVFYGDNINEADKEIAQQLVKANAINLAISDYSINFSKSYQQALEVLQ